MYQIINKVLGSKVSQDIVIIGKGPSIDEIDLSLLDDYIVINTNDSELIYPGSIAVFHHDWVIDSINQNTPHCKLYISDKVVPGKIERIIVEFIPYTPQTSNFLLNRFFSETIYSEHAVIITALRVANEIAQLQGVKKNVYLLGFDFTAKKGFTNKVPSANIHDDPDYQEFIINSHEKLLKMILVEKERLSIKIKHIGSKEYSEYSGGAFNSIFATRKKTIPIMESKLIAKSRTTFKVKIVAEITTNHFGDMDRLKAMILAAKDAGADLIKLQKRDVETFYTIEQLDAFYRSPFGKTFYDYRIGIELNLEQFKLVDKYCKELNIGWFASILDIPSYEFIQEFEPNIIKIPSTISEHREYLSYIGKDFKNDVVISTGDTEQSYESFILNTFTKARKIYLLQCTSAYPTQIEEAQVSIVRHYYNLSKNDPRIIPGFSSHDIGSQCSMLAVAAGALMIEKHVKLGDVTWSHFDEVAVDLTNGDFDRFVADVRRAEKIIGNEHKVIYKSEHHKYFPNS